MKFAQSLRRQFLLIIAFLMIGSLFIGDSTPIFAQSGSITATADVSDAAPDIGDQITVDIVIDMTNVDSPDDALGSFSSVLTWDTAVLSYDSNSALNPDFVGVVISAVSGEVTFNGVSVSGATGEFTVLTFTFDVVGAGSGDLDLSYTAMAAAGTFANLLPLVAASADSVQVDTVMYELTVNFSGSGDVTLDPAGGMYADGTEVELTAVPVSGWQFDNWSGDLIGSTNPQTIVMDSDKTVTATFAQLPPQGEVTSSAIASDDTPTVGEQITVDIVIDMTNMNAPNDALGGFTGILNWDTAVLAYNSDSDIGAGFLGVINNANPGELTFNGVNVSGATGEFTVLTITFDVVGAGNSDLDLDYSAMAAAATFTDLLPFLAVNDDSVDASPVQYDLTINFTGSGGVTLDPAGGTYDDGTVVELTAVPVSGWYFTGWSGDLTGSDNPETITMDSDKTVMANFAAIPPAIVINEIIQDPSAVTDANGEWFELYNPTANPVDINGWTIEDNDSDGHVIDNGGSLIIPAGGYLVLGRNGNSGTNGGVSVDYDYSSFTLANDDDEVVLLDTNLFEVDRVEYDDGATFPDPTGASMSLISPSLNNNNGANWCTSTTPFGDGDLGTPGEENSCEVVPPTPTNTPTTIPPTATSTPTNTPTTIPPTPTNTPTNTPTLIPPTPTNTPTNTPTTIPPTATNTATNTPTTIPPTPTNTATNTPTIIPPTPTNTATNTPTTIPPTATNTPISPTPTSTPSPEIDMLYISVDKRVRLDGNFYYDEDIVVYDADTDSWSMVFDGSDVGLQRTDVNALHMLDDGSILLSVDRPLFISHFGWLDDSDIVRFVPASLGETTSGHFELYFDGSDVKLSRAGEDIDAIGFTPDGRLLISTIGPARVFGASSNDEDLLVFNAFSLGAHTWGYFETYFDGSNIGLSFGSEDVWGAWVDPANSDIYLTTQGSFRLANGLRGFGKDIFTCSPDTLGAHNTSCSATNLAWSGAVHGLWVHSIDGFSIVK